MKKDRDTLDLPFQAAGEIIAERLDLSMLEIPPEYESKDSLVEDDALRRSIEKSGVQQSIVVIPDGDRFVVAKGVRRVRVCRLLGLQDIPAVISEPAPGVDLKAYRDRLRMILTQARQDLLPSQRAELIRSMMKQFDMTQAEVASLLGVDPGSLTNWLSVDRYIPEVRRAIDENRLTMHSARSFDGMTPHGQKRVWEECAGALFEMSGSKAHKFVRAKYKPEKFPAFYVAPERTLEKMSRPAKKRAMKKRPRLTQTEKEVLSRDLSLREVELEEAKEELATLKKSITLATQPIRAILHNEDLVTLIPKKMKAELDRFYEVYC